MSKVTYIIKASEDSISENAAKVFVAIAKKDFITASEIREALENELAPGSINSNIGVLSKKGLIEKSGEGYIITGEGQDVLSKAAEIYATENKPELLKKRNTRKARPLTEDMAEHKDLMMSILGEMEDILPLKELTVYRSNYIAVLEKRTFGIRSLEVNNKGTFRIFGYKISEEHQKHFTDLGMSCRVAATGNTYLDIARTSDNIEKIIRSIKEL